MSYFVGLDLGQSGEHTALAVVEDVPQQTPWGVNPAHHLYVRHLERYPLRTSYPDIALAVAAMKSPELVTKVRDPWEPVGYTLTPELEATLQATQLQGRGGATR